MIKTSIIKIYVKLPAYIIFPKIENKTQMEAFTTSIQHCRKILSSITM